MKKEYTFKVYGNQLRFDYFPYARERGKIQTFHLTKRLSSFIVTERGDMEIF